MKHVDCKVGNTKRNKAIKKDEKNIILYKHQTPNKRRVQINAGFRRSSFK